MVGYRLRMGETIAEFAKRVGEGEAGLALRFITPWERTVYRGDPADSSMIAEAKTDRDDLFRTIKVTSKWRYYWVRWRTW
jgi:hypothetical protein